MILVLMDFHVFDSAESYQVPPIFSFKCLYPVAISTGLNLQYLCHELIKHLLHGQINFLPCYSIIVTSLITSPNNGAHHFYFNVPLGLCLSFVCSKANHFNVPYLTQ